MPKINDVIEPINLEKYLLISEVFSTNNYTGLISKI